MYELVMQIGIQESAKGVSRLGGTRQKKDEVNFSVAGDEGTVEDYEHFLGSETGREPETRKLHVANILENIVATLRAQMRQGITKEDSEETSADLDAWRYREEAEREAAETGDSEVETDLPSAEVLEKEHRKVHRTYIRLVQGLRQRCECLRDHPTTIGPEEFWRLDAVNLLLLHGCERSIEDAKDCGPVVIPQDIMSDYLTAVAIFLGRVRATSGISVGNGPLLQWATVDQSDAKVVQTALTTCAVLIGLAAVCRQTDQEKTKGLPDYIRHNDILVVRCFAALLRLNLLPLRDMFIEEVRHSAWLGNLGCDALERLFANASSFARSVLRYEDQFQIEQACKPLINVNPGDWVCTADSGVTECVRKSPTDIDIAMIGQPESGKERKVDASRIQRVNLPSRERSKGKSVLEDELDWLLPYTDQDFDEWRNLITPDLERAYLFALFKVTKHANSQQLRNEAARVVEERSRRPSK